MMTWPPFFVSPPARSSLGESGSLHFLVSLFLGLSVFLFFSSSPISAQISDTGTSLYFSGNHPPDITTDRFVIPLTQNEQSLPANIGTDEFTIEFWIKTNPLDNSGGPTCTPSSTSNLSSNHWQNYHIIVDRSISDATHPSYGISITPDGHPVFGVSQNNSHFTLCNPRSISDGLWHHLAVTRNTLTNQFGMFVDGYLDVTIPAPLGDLNYPAYLTTPDSTFDSYLVIGGPKYPPSSTSPPWAFKGWIDEFRISNRSRYSIRPDPFKPDRIPHPQNDPITVALYHFDTPILGPCTDSLFDYSPFGSTLNSGRCRPGGGGPLFTSDTPIIGIDSQPTPTTPPPTPTLAPISLIYLLSSWFTSFPELDFNSDQIVNSLDFLSSKNLSLDP